MAIRAWNLLNNGQGAIDWAGLDLVAALLGVQDIEALINRLLIIKSHKPKD